jgi:hypothetical protein
MSKTSSELISWFQKTKQILQLDEEKNKLKNFTDKIAQRRIRLEKKLGIETSKDQKSMNKSIE